MSEDLKGETRHQGSMPETVLGFISRIALNPLHGLGTKSHAMLVTDARTMILPWREGEVLLGALIDSGVVESNGIVQAGGALDPEIWAKQEGVVVIPHAHMDRLRCSRVLNTYSVSVEFRTNAGHRRLSGFLLPSRGYLRRSKREGIPAAKSAFAYARQVGAVLQRVPPLKTVLDWRL